MLSGSVVKKNVYTTWKHANKTVLFKCKHLPVLWITVPEALCKGIAGYLQLCDLKFRAQNIN